MKHLGRGIVTQKTIGEIVNKEDIESFLSKNADAIKNILKHKPDKYEMKYLITLKNKKNLFLI